MDVKKHIIEVDDETYQAIQDLKHAVIESTADPISDELAIYLGTRLAVLINQYPQEKWKDCLGLSLAETYKKKREGKVA